MATVGQVEVQWSGVLESLVRALGIVKLDVLVQGLSSLRNIIIFFEVNLLVLECSPESLDEHVVGPPSTTIHTDLDLSLFQF